MAQDEQYPQWQLWTPDGVKTLTAPTPSFLCPLSANTKGLDFIRFKVRSLDEGAQKTLFEVGRPEGFSPPPLESLDDTSRFIRYDFGSEFLNFDTIGTTLEFTIGDEPIHDLM